MRGQMLRITAVILCGLAVAIGTGWGAGSPALVGEAVADDVAAAERGGDCPFWACGHAAQGSCFATNRTNGGHVCPAGTVVCDDGVAPMKKAECSVYCG